jgi:hypothetical protein
MNAFAVGRIWQTWMSFSMMIWRRLRLMCFFRRSLAISASIAWAFPGGSVAVRLAPSSRKPRISFVRSKRASPLSHFFLDTESLPPSWPVISGGGKVEWIVCRAAWAILLMRVPSLLSTAPRM